MSELLNLSTHELMDRLPPVEHAPILDQLGSLGLIKFKEKYAIETPTDDETGIVNHLKLMQEMGRLVSKDYRWQAPFFDEHHLHWYASTYASPLARRFRNLPIHKLWVPRQFHDFVHVMTLPTEKPHDDVMEASVKAFDQDDQLFQVTNEIMTLQERIDNALPYQPGYVLVPETGGKRQLKSRKEGVLEGRRLEFLQEVEERIKADPTLSLSFLSRLELLSTDAIGEALPSIRREIGVRVARTSSRRKARAVRLPIAERKAA
ncbi:MAG: hypothetical protein JWM52_81 [Candidatus Saccharibacteria bacterium]|nr:hypothetical protein [Candidatus Saccharibacteria bacterium]